MSERIDVPNMNMSEEALREMHEKMKVRPKKKGKKTKRKKGGIKKEKVEKKQTVI